MIADSIISVIVFAGWILVHCVFILCSIESLVPIHVGEKEEFEQELMNYKVQYHNKVSGLLQQSKCLIRSPSPSLPLPLQIGRAK